MTQKFVTLPREKMNAFAAAAAGEDGATINALRARVEELETQLDAIGAGGAGPVMTPTFGHHGNVNSCNDLQRKTESSITSVGIIPTGWKLVPVEPNMTMTQTALNASRRWAECDAPLPRGQELWAAGVCWKAMLDAAPQPPAVEQPTGGAREAFEAWCRLVGLMQQSHGIVSINSHTDTAWLAWQAAIANGQQPQGDQEPVAFAIFTEAGNARMWSTFQPHVQKLADAEGLTVTPLYTKPQPKLDPLTDEWIDAIAEAMPGGLEGFMKGWGWRQFARAVIEATHNIK